MNLLEKLQSSSFFIDPEHLRYTANLMEAEEDDEKTWTKGEQTLQGIRPHHSLQASLSTQELQTAHTD